MELAARIEELWEAGAVDAVFCDPDAPCIEEVDRLLDRSGVDLSRLPQLLYPCGQLHHAGSSPIGLVTNRWSTS